MSPLSLAKLSEWCKTHSYSFVVQLRGVDVPYFVIRGILRKGGKSTPESTAFLREVEQFVREQTGISSRRAQSGALYYGGGTAIAVMAWLGLIPPITRLEWHGSIATDGTSIYLQKAGTPSVHPRPGNILSYKIDDLIEKRKSMTLEQIGDILDLYPQRLVDIYRFLSIRGWEVVTPKEAPISMEGGFDSRTHKGAYLLGLLWGAVEQETEYGFKISAAKKESLEKINEALRLNGYVEPDGNTYRLFANTRESRARLRHHANLHGLPLDVGSTYRPAPICNFDFLGFFVGYYEIHGWTGQTTDKRTGATRRYLCICGSESVLQMLSLELHEKIKVRHRRVRRARPASKTINISIIDYSTGDTDLIRAYLATISAKKDALK